MSGRYYELARQQPGSAAGISAQQMTINLDATVAADLICSDSDLARKRKNGDILYVSGGGSVVLAGRYLLVVQREANARIHPGKFSLFTGRADGLGERENPSLLARELFEELLLYRGGQLVWPLNPQYQQIIDRIYTGLGHKRDEAVGVAFGSLPLPTRPLVVTSRGVTRRFDLAWHLSSKGEINVLQLFSVDLRPQDLVARDGEGLDRSIWAYDMESSGATPVGAGAGQRKLNDADMTEHLAFTIRSLAATGKDAARAS